MAKRIRWSPKLPPQLLKRLYLSSLSGVHDDGLMDEVGIRLYLRCESIVMISRGVFFCPECGERVFAKEAGPDDAVVCAKCSFRCTRTEFHESYRHADLWQGNAGTYFEKFYLDYPQAADFNEKIILIDTLIHSFHMDAKAGLPNRAAGNNLIEGSLEQVVALLNELSGIQPENDSAFQETAAAMWQRRKGKPIL